MNVDIKKLIEYAQNAQNAMLDNASVAMTELLRKVWVIQSNKMSDIADALRELQAYRECLTMEEAKQRRWIPCDARLPMRNEDVLVADRDGDVYVLHLGGMGYFCDNNGSEGGAAGCYITHWMPLPEPPKEEIGNDARPVCVMEGGKYGKQD